MNIIFNKCSEAISHSLSGGKYGIFYSKNSVPETSIHVHNCCEVLFCVSGGDTFLIDDSIYNVNDGDMIVAASYNSTDTLCADAKYKSIAHGKPSQIEYIIIPIIVKPGSLSHCLGSTSNLPSIIFKRPVRSG